VVYAQDQAMTPISESVRKREFIQSIPTLQGLGVPNKTLLSELVRALGLPESFIEEADQATAAISAAKAEAAGSAVQPDVVEVQQGMQPTGPNNLQAILNTGEG
jgi:DNA-binding PucR family transcriptional regulator